jgi:hypothetical protein
VLYCVSRYYHRLSNLPTIRSDLYGDTTIDYLLCSTLSRDTATDYLLRSTLSVDATADYPIYRLSALIGKAMLQTPVYCALLCLAILPPTIQSTDYPL